MNSSPDPFLLEHSIPFEFQKGDPEEIARERTARAQEVKPGLCRRRS